MDTHYKAQLVRSFLCLGLVGGLASVCSAKNQHRQTVTVGIENRESGNSEVDRVSVSTNMSWKTGRRENISLTLPWQKVSSDSGVGAARTSNSASGIMDATLNYTFAPKQRGENLQTRWQLNMNLPTGKDSLNATELAAVSAVNGSANGFLNTQFGRGFGAGIKHYWDKKQGNANNTFYVGYNEESSYTFSNSPTSRVENTGVDTYSLGAKRSFERGSLGVTFGVDAIFFDSTQTITNGQGVKIDSDPNYIFSASLDKTAADRLHFLFNLSYQMRDKQDTFNPGIQVLIPGALARTVSSLGDRFFWSAVAERQESSGKGKWQAGFSGIHTGPQDSTNSTGTTAFHGNSADEIYTRLGYERSLNSGASWSVLSDIGLTSDSRDYAITGSYNRQF